MAKNTVVCYLVFFVSLNTLGEKKTFSETENRVLQTKPTFSIEKLFEGRFTGKYEDYKVDQFLIEIFGLM